MPLVLIGLSTLMLLGVLLFPSPAKTDSKIRNKFKPTIQDSSSPKSNSPSWVEFSRPDGVTQREPSYAKTPDQPLNQRDLPSLIRALGSHVELPLAYSGAEVVAAEEWQYENGTEDIMCVLDVGLGQEKILLVGRSGKESTRRHIAFFSAERLNALVDRAHWKYIKPVLATAGFEVRENRYGAPVLNLRFLGEPSGFMTAKAKVEQILGHWGDIFLTPPFQEKKTDIGLHLDQLTR